MKVKSYRKRNLSYGLFSLLWINFEYYIDMEYLTEFFHKYLYLLIWNEV